MKVIDITKKIIHLNWPCSQNNIVDGIVTLVIRNHRKEQEIKRDESHVRMMVLKMWQDSIG